LRRPLVFASSALAGIGAAALVIWLSRGLSGVTKPVSLPPIAKITSQNNKQRLNSAEIETLEQWARSYRTCAQRRGLLLVEPVVHGNELLMTANKGSKISLPQLRRSLRCTNETGDPPLRTSFVLSGGKLHLYRPRACLLPVTREKT
jgi:hypothetical protein